MERHHNKEAANVAGSLGFTTEGQPELVDAAITRLRRLSDKFSCGALNNCAPRYDHSFSTMDSGSLEAHGGRSSRRHSAGENEYVPSHARAIGAYRRVSSAETEGLRKRAFHNNESEEPVFNNVDSEQAASPWRLHNAEGQYNIEEGPRNTENDEAEVSGAQTAAPSNEVAQKVGSPVMVQLSPESEHALEKYAEQEKLRETRVSTLLDGDAPGKSTDALTNQNDDYIGTISLSDLKGPIEKVTEQHGEHPTINESAANNDLHGQQQLTASSAKGQPDKEAKPATSADLADISIVSDGYSNESEERARANEVKLELSRSRTAADGDKISPEEVSWKDPVFQNAANNEQNAANNEHDEKFPEGLDPKRKSALRAAAVSMGAAVEKKVREGFEKFATSLDEINKARQNDAAVGVSPESFPDPEAFVGRAKPSRETRKYVL